LAADFDVVAGVAVEVPVPLWLAVATTLPLPVALVPEFTEDVPVAFDDPAADAEEEAGPPAADESYSIC
jgi:hypothetical protein